MGEVDQLGGEEGEIQVRCRHQGGTMQNMEGRRKDKGGGGGGGSGAGSGGGAGGGGGNLLQF